MRTLYVDSRSGVGTASNFTIDLNRTLHIPEGGKFRVDNLRIPLTFNTVNVNNCHLYYVDNGLFYQAVIARGIYASVTLAIAIQAAFAATGAPSHVTVFFDASNGNTTFSVNQVGSWVLLSDASVADFPTYYPGVDVKNPQSFNSVLGFPSSGVTHVGSVYTFPCISVLAYDELYLCSSKLSSQTVQSPWGGSSVICVAVVIGVFGDILKTETPLMFWNDIGPISMKQIDFQLTDRFGNPVNVLAGNISFQLTVDTLSHD